jgi:hypothetical protein
MQFLLCKETLQHEDVYSYNINRILLKEGLEGTAQHKMDFRRVWRRRSRPKCGTEMCPAAFKTYSIDFVRRFPFSLKIGFYYRNEMKFTTATGFILAQYVPF